MYDFKLPSNLMSRRQAAPQMSDMMGAMGGASGAPMRQPPSLSPQMQQMMSYYNPSQMAPKTPNNAPFGGFGGDFGMGMGQANQMPQMSSFGGPMGQGLPAQRQQSGGPSFFTV
jgi:hypothetical protein